MNIILNATERKPLATLLGEYKNTKPQYLRAPSYAYQIGDLLLTREGNIEGPDTLSQTEFDELLALLDASGYCPKETDFHPAQEPKAKTTSTEETGLTITIPLENVNIGNLTKLLDAKGFLIKRALHIDDLRFELNEDSISFPWFSELPEPDDVHAYSTLIAALCKMSKDQKRISPTEKPVDNERYAFRCFLLRLGFIGDNYKIDRKILMRYLPGNSAFKGGEGHAISK
ncbi:virulence [[Clostridium] innocuum]|nr:virulence [[Clostridium] innocuum]